MKNLGGKTFEMLSIWAQVEENNASEKVIGFIKN